MVVNGSATATSSNTRCIPAGIWMVVNVCRKKDLYKNRYIFVEIELAGFTNIKKGGSVAT